MHLLQHLNMVGKKKVVFFFSSHQMITTMKYEDASALLMEVLSGIADHSPHVHLVSK